MYDEQWAAEIGILCSFDDQRASKSDPVLVPVSRLGLEVEEDATPEEVVFAAAVHGALDRLEAVDGALNAALAPRKDHAVGDLLLTHKVSAGGRRSWTRVQKGQPWVDCRVVRRGEGSAAWGDSRAGGMCTAAKLTPRMLGAAL